MLMWVWKLLTQEMARFGFVGQARVSRVFVWEVWEALWVGGEVVAVWRSECWESLTRDLKRDDADRIRYHVLV